MADRMNEAVTGLSHVDVDKKSDIPLAVAEPVQAEKTEIEEATTIAKLEGDEILENQSAPATNRSKFLYLGILVVLVMGLIIMVSNNGKNNAQANDGSSASSMATQSTSSSSGNSYNTVTMEPAIPLPKAKKDKIGIKDSTLDGYNGDGSSPVSKSAKEKKVIKVKDGVNEVMKAVTENVDDDKTKKETLVDNSIEAFNDIKNIFVDSAKNSPSPLNIQSPTPPVP